MQVVATVLTALSLLAATQAQTTHRVTLKGGNQLPAVSTDATAQLTITFNADSNNVTYNLVFNKVPFPVAAHIHVNAGPNQNGSVGVPLWQANFAAPSNARPVSGLVASNAVANSAFVGPLEKLPAFNNVAVSQLLSEYINAGKAYAQVHTLTHPKGFIRGNFNAGTRANNLGPIKPATQAPPTVATPAVNAAVESIQVAG